MVIECDECKKVFQGDKNDPTKIFVCRFCMGEGLPAGKFDDKLAAAEKKIDALKAALTKAVFWWEPSNSTPLEVKEFNECHRILKGEE